MALLGLCVGAGFLALRVLTERPCPTVHYDRLEHELTVSRQPVGPNGWDLIAQSAAKLDAVEVGVLERWGSEYAAEALAKGEDRATFWYSVLRHNAEALAREYSDADDREFIALARAALAEAQRVGVTDAFRDVGACPRCVMPMRVIGERSHWWKARVLSDLLLAELRAAHLEDDRARVRTLVESVGVLTQCLMEQDNLFAHLIAESLIRKLCEEIRAQGSHRPFDLETGEELIRVLGSIDARASAHRAIESLERAMRDTIQRMYTRDPDGDGRFVPSACRAMPYSEMPEPVADWPDPVIEFGGLILPSRRWVEREVTRVREMLHSVLDAPRSERNAIFDAPGYEESIPLTARFLGWWVGSADRVIDRCDRAEMFIDGTRLVAAIHVHRARHGEYPRSLADLVPGVLAELPRDPFAPDGAFRYRVLPDGGFALYSVGRDGADNDGHFYPQFIERALEELGDYGSGFDFVLTQVDAAVQIEDGEQDLRSE